MTRRLGLVPLAIVALLLAACGDDGGDDVAAAGSSTTDEVTTDGVTPEDLSTDAVCTALDIAVLDQVEDPGPADTRSEDDPPPPEEVQRDEEIAAALGRIAEGGPDELRDDATTILDLYDVVLDDPHAVTDDARDASSEASQRLLDWGVASCEVPEPIWSCAQRGMFRLVGARIDGPPDTGPLPVDPPEDGVRGGVDVDPSWEVVEVERTERRVTFAWLDADGLAVRSETVAARYGSWVSDVTSSCDTGFDLVPPDQVGEDLPPDEPPPPPGSSSVPTE